MDWSEPWLEPRTKWQAVQPEETGRDIWTIFIVLECFIPSLFTVWMNSRWFREKQFQAIHLTLWWNCDGSYRASVITIMKTILLKFDKNCSVITVCPLLSPSYLPDRSSWLAIPESAAAAVFFLLIFLPTIAKCFLIESHLTVQQ